MSKAPARGMPAAVVLCGGLGTRLRSVVSDRPKVLAQVAGRPYLAHLLDELAGAGIGRAVMCTGYMADEVARVLGAEHRGMELVYSPEESPLGTGGALRLALEHIREDTVLVSNGDSFLEADLPGFADWFAGLGAQGALLLTKVVDCARYGAVDLDDRGRVAAFVEKGGRSGPGWINGGIYLLRREAIESIPPGRKFSLESELFPELAARGLLYGRRTDGGFIDIGTPESYERAQAFFRERSRA